MSCCWAINSFFLLWLSFLVSASSFFTFSSWALVSAWSYFLQYIAFLHYQFCSLQYIALYYYLHHQFSLTNSAYIYHLAQWFLMFEERNEIFNVWGKKWKWTIFPPTNVESFEIYTQGGGGDFLLYLLFFLDFFFHVRDNTSQIFLRVLNKGNYIKLIHHKRSFIQ